MNVSEESVFAEAIEIADPTERAAFLDRACAGNAKLRAGVEALLASYAAGSFLEVPALPRSGGEKSYPSPLSDTQADAPGQNDEAHTLEFLTPSEKPDSLGRLGHYEILEVIGQGGMGIVLRAFDEKLQRVVAIKVMSPELAATSPPRKRFLREARSAAQVRHEHVVDIHAVEDLPVPYLVMEYVSGETLQQKLDRIGPLETPEVLRLGQQIARGLAAAHERGLIHRDIKPSNILLEKGAEEQVKITDFGLARAVADASLTQSGVIAGTPMYMAPEQTVGDTIDHRADLFSLGSVLYTMVSGRPPFRATTSMATLKRVAEDEPRPIREIIPEVPEWLCDIIAKLHAKKPEERFQSAKEVAELLRQHLAHLENPALVPLPAPVVLVQKAAVAEEPAPQSILPSPLGGEGSGVRGQRRRRWPIAAATLLCLVAGLALTEATGVTNLRATVIRILTPDGTLVVEVDDPGVKVTIEGDGGLTITGAGLEEIRLRPGSYKVHADRDGKKVPLERELVSIAKGGREVVRVKLEGPPAQVVAKAAKGAFVLLGGKGVEVGKFDTLAEAVRRAGAGDTIEIRGNGPFLIDPIEHGLKNLTIRAGSGYVPVIKPSPATVKGDNAALLQVHGPVTLEGLELHHEGSPQKSERGFIERGIIAADSAPLHLTNCKLVVNPGKPIHTWALLAMNPSHGQVRNCLIVSPGNGIMLWNAPGMHWTVENCLIATGFENRGSPVSLIPDTENSPGTKLRLTRNTLVSGAALAVYGPQDPLGKRLRDKSAKAVVPALVEADENICQLRRVFILNSDGGTLKPSLTVEEQQQFLPKLMQWREQGNVYGLADKFFLHLHTPPTPTGLLNGLAEWNKSWGIKDTGSVQGTVRLRGNPKEMLTTNPEGITPDDFRLRPDSAGYQAGKDKKDLGADVDLVGPGAAYERWKKTPEYQQWLKETGQLKTESPKAETNAFVVLGGKGVEVGKFDTLAEAIQRASSGDTIEVRGNGPFITDPIQVNKLNLTIRAGDTWTPVIRLSPRGTEGAEPLLRTNARLVLEGLDLEWPRRSTPHVFTAIVWSDGGPLSAANCRFRVSGVPWQACIIGWNAPLLFRNCQFLCPGSHSVMGGFPEVVLNNCLHLGRHLTVLGGAANYRLTRNTVVATDADTLFTAVQFQLIEPPKDKEVASKQSVDATGNVFVAKSALRFDQMTEYVQKFGRLEARKEEALLPRLVRWRDRGNLYSTGAASVLWEGTRTTLGKPADWKKYWGDADGDLTEGTIRLQGGDLAARAVTDADKITPDDFRLRPDSPGYQAGKDKKDLGADVDLVGPGPAYERWKKTPEYQTWLKETGQKK